MDFQAQKSTAGAGSPHLSAHISITLLQLRHSLLKPGAPRAVSSIYARYCSSERVLQVGYPLGGAVPQSLFVMAPTPLSKTFIGDQELNPRQHHLK